MIYRIDLLVSELVLTLDTDKGTLLEHTYYDETDHDISNCLKRIPGVGVVILDDDGAPALVLEVNTADLSYVVTSCDLEYTNGRLATRRASFGAHTAPTTPEELQACAVVFVDALGCLFEYKGVCVCNIVKGIAR